LNEFDIADTYLGLTLRQN